LFVLFFHRSQVKIDAVRHVQDDHVEEVFADCQVCPIHNDNRRREWEWAISVGAILHLWSKMFL